MTAAARIGGGGIEATARRGGAKMAVLARVTVAVELRESVGGGGIAGEDRLNFSQQYQFVDAVGPLGVTKSWGDERTLTGTEWLDLNGGVVDRLGQTEAFTTGKVLLVHNRPRRGD
ncbi:MAG: hypothetical protein WKF75_05635 [Singulisphaera sp.]